MRIMKFVLGVISVVAIMACIQGCEAVDNSFMGNITGEWTTTGPDGQAERVVFDEETVTFGHGTDGSYECPYRVGSFSEKTRTINIRLSCEKRTGAKSPVAYLLKFHESEKAFTIHLEGRNIGEFRTVASR